MAYLLPDNFLEKMFRLRINFEKQSNIDDLKNAAQPYQVSKFFGATDVKKRNAQISLVENVLNSLKADLVQDNHFDSEEALQKHVRAVRILVSLCLYIVEEVDSKYYVRSSKNSDLVDLIKDALGGEIDENSRACSLLAAKRFTKIPLEDINSKLKDKISEKEWEKFKKFIKVKTKNINAKQYHAFSATHLTIPLFKYPTQYAGMVIGFIAGKTIAHTTIALPLEYSIVNLFTSAANLFGRSHSSLGVALVAPTVAGQALSYYSGLTCASLAGKATGLVGTGVGWTIGKGIDYSFYTVYSIFSLLASYCYNHGKQNPQSGIDLVNGHFITGGVKLKFVELTLEEIEILKAMDPKNIHMHEEGLEVNGKTVPWIQHEQPFIDELKTLIAKNAAETDETVAEKTQAEMF